MRITFKTRLRNRLKFWDGFRIRTRSRFRIRVRIRFKFKARFRFWVGFKVRIRARTKGYCWVAHLLVRDCWLIAM